MLKSFLRKHGSLIEASSKAAGAGLGAYLLLSGKWTFVTLGQAVAACGGAVGELRRLSDHADRQGEGLNRKARLSLLLSLAAREAYLEAIAESLPRTLADWESRGITGVLTTQDTGVDPGPECDFKSNVPLAEFARPTFEFLESKLAGLLARAEVPNLERVKILRVVREEAEQHLRMVVADNQSRFGVIMYHQLLLAADVALATGNANTADCPNAIASPGAGVFEPNAPPALNLTPPARASKGPQPGLTAAPEGLPGLPEALRKIYEDRFAAARRELDGGSSEKGAALFAELIGEMRQLAAPELDPLLARCLHNRGIALFNSDRRGEAAACFDEAVTFPGINTKTKAGVFFAPYCRQDFAGALAAVRQLRLACPEEADFAVYEAECLIRLDQPAAALAVLDQCDSRSEMFFTLQSQLRANQADFPAAKRIAMEGLVRYPESCQLRAAAAFADAKPIFDRLHGERSARKYVPPEEAEILRQLHHTYTAVAETARRSALRVIAAEAYAMLGAISLALREERAALRHLDESLALVPDNAVAWGNKHMALVRLDDFAGARALARQAAEIFGEAEALGREVATWLEEGQPEVACERVAEALQRNPALKQDRHLHVLWLQSLALARRQALAGTETLAFVESSGRSPHDLMVAAEIFESLGDRTRAQALIERAEREAAGEEALAVRQIAGLIFFRRNEWTEAIRRLGSDGMDPVESVHVVEILVCLINLRDLPGALSLGERLRTLGRADSRVNRALAHVYMQIGRESDAEPLLRELVAQHRSYPDYLSLFRVAQLLHPLRTALPVLEEAVRSFPERFEGHLYLSEAYFVLQQYAMSLEEARTAHRLAPGQPETVRNFARFMIAPIDSSLLTPSDREVIQKALADESVFHRVEIPEKDGKLDISNIVTVLQGRQEHVSRVLDMYRGKRLPLAAAAVALGRSPFEMWWSLAHTPGEHLQMANGDAAEQARELHACGETSSVAIDASALFTLAELGLIDLLGRLFGRIYFDAETLAALKKDHVRLSTQQATTRHMVYHEGRLVVTETDAAERHAEYRRLEELMAFLHGGGKVVAGGPSGAVWADFQANARWRELADNLAEGTLGPALIAKSVNCAYYCDDLGLRGLAAQELGVANISTQALLRHAHRQGVLTEAAYDAAVATLLLRNYQFVSTDRQFLLRHLRAHGFSRDPVSERLIREIGLTTFGQSPGPMELGVAASYLWFNGADGNRTPRTEWLKLIGQGLARIPPGKNTVPMFVVGLLADLRQFPEAFIGLTDVLIYELDLPARLARRLSLARGSLMTSLMQGKIAFQDLTLAAKWQRAVVNARYWRKTAGSLHRL